MSEPQPPEWHTKWEDLDVQVLSELCRVYFDDQAVLDQINEQAEDTLNWMRQNLRSYEADGAEKFEPWWPKLPYTENEIVLETRARRLRDKAYEHGILDYVFGLAERGVLNYPNKKRIGCLVEAMTPIVLNQLLGAKYSEHGPDGIWLSTFRDWYGNGKGTNPARLRERVLRPLLPLGIYEAKYDTEYSIAVGPVANTFFTNVYYPIIREMNINPKGQE